MSYYLVLVRGKVFEVCTNSVDAYRARNNYRKLLGATAVRVREVATYENRKFL